MNAEPWLELAKQNWLRPAGLIYALVADFLASLAISAALPPAIAAAIGGVAALVLILTWAYSRRLPRCPRGKLGFVVSFSCDDPAIKGQFKSDFSNQLKQLLSDGPAGRVFWFKDLSGKEGAEIVTVEDARFLRERTRASYVLYGTVRSRGKKNARKHYLDIQGMVWHGSIGAHNQQLLAQEFSELLPSRVEVPDDGTLPAFEFTSQLAGLASEYIIAVALECAGALNEAELLLDDLEPKAANANVVQHGLKIAQRIPTRRMEICVARANQVYKQWRDSRSDDLLVAIDELLNQVPTSERKRLPWLGLKAIVQVAHEDDLQAAEQTVLSCGREQPTTQMNLAFLKACHGDLRGATRHYRNAKGANVNLELVEEIMDFIEWYRLFKPALDVEMCYCLGFISLEIIKDTILANQYFTRFAEVADDRYRQEQLLVEKWMGELSGE